MPVLTTTVIRCSPIDRLCCTRILKFQHAIGHCASSSALRRRVLRVPLKNRSPHISHRKLPASLRDCFRLRLLFSFTFSPVPSPKINYSKSCSTSRLKSRRRMNSKRKLYRFLLCHIFRILGKTICSPPFSLCDPSYGKCRQIGCVVKLGSCLPR